MDTQESPIQSLTCCCCGESTKGRQWHNRDRGYGLCPACAVEIKGRGETDWFMASMYGIEGTHYNVA